MLAVVVIFDVEFNALTTFELRLNPAAFKLPAITLPLADTEPALMAAPVMILPPVMLPVALTNPGVVTFAPAMSPVTFNALTTFELKLNPAAFKLPPVTLPLADTEPALTAALVTMLPPVMLPVAEINPGVVTLPLAMFAVTFKLLTTFELRLNPAAFKLPPVTLPEALTIPVLTLPLVTLPVALINPGVVMFEPAISPDTFKLLTTLLDKLRPAAFKFPPVMLPLADTEPALTAALVMMLPPVILPLALITPVTYCPVSATTTTFAVPFTPVVMLPLATAMSTFDVPLAILLAVSADTPVNWLPLPIK